MIHVIATRGLPASGKSTWARPYAYDNGFLRWNNDEFSRMVTGTSDPAASFKAMDGKLLGKMRRHFITQATYRGNSIIVDNTNLNPRTINEIHHNVGVPEYQYTFEIVDFRTSVEECIRRDQARAHSVGEDVIMMMVDRFGHLYDWIDNGA